MADKKGPNTDLTAKNAADRALRAAHLDEWHDLVAKEYAARGLGEYQRPLTADEKAAQKIEEMLAKHPNLRAQFGTVVGSAAPEPDAAA
jgi:inosine/xanthosine triphosphate pyrophosphatase family protein